MARGVVDDAETLSTRKTDKEPTNCGTKAADVLANFYPANFNANPLNILVLLAFKLIGTEGYRYLKVFYLTTGLNVMLILVTLINHKAT